MKIKKLLYLLVITVVISIMPGAIPTYSDTTVYVTPTGECYHAYPHGRGNFSKTTLSNALRLGLRPCQKCRPDSGTSSSSHKTSSSGNHRSSSSGSSYKTSTSSSYKSSTGSSNTKNTSSNKYANNYKKLQEYLKKNGTYDGSNYSIEYSQGTHYAKISYGKKDGYNFFYADPDDSSDEYYSILLSFSSANSKTADITYCYFEDINYVDDCSFALYAKEAKNKYGPTSSTKWKKVSGYKTKNLSAQKKWADIMVEVSQDAWNFLLDEADLNLTKLGILDK